MHKSPQQPPGSAFDLAHLLRHLRRISGRDAHLAGKVAKALMEKAPFADLYGFVHPVHTATFIAGISGQTAPSGVGVYINTDGQLGMLTVQELKSIVAKQQATIAQQRKDFEANTAQQQKEIQAVTPSLNEQAAQIQKVGA